MNRLEISGYVQIVIGFVGIVVTLLTAPNLLNAVGTATSGGGMPPEFAGASGIIRIFSVLVLLFALIFLVMLGLAITLATLVENLGGHNPFLASLAAVSGVLALALTATLAIIGINYWIAGFVGSLGLLISSIIICGEDENLENTGIIFTIFIVLFLITGLGCVISHSS